MRRNLPISNPHPLALLLPVLHKKVQPESMKKIAGTKNEYPHAVNDQTSIKNSQIGKLNENIFSRLKSNEMYEGDNNFSPDSTNNNMELTNEMRTILNLGQAAMIENKHFRGDNFFKSKFPSIKKYIDSNYRFYSNGTLSGLSTIPSDEIKSKALEGKDFSDLDFFESPPQKKNLETSVVQATNNSNLLKNTSVISQINSNLLGSVNKIKTTNKNSDEDGKTTELGYSTDSPNAFKEDGQKTSEADEEDDGKLENFFCFILRRIFFRLLCVVILIIFVIILRWSSSKKILKNQTFVFGVL